MWIHFTNIGDWGDQVVERLSITEFIQYANGIKAAAYYHVFKDANGNPLDGSNPRGYVLTFPAGLLPEFRSLLVRHRIYPGGDRTGR